MILLCTFAGGLVIGFLAQRSRFCMVAPMRDFILTRRWAVWSGVASLAVVSFGLYSLAIHWGWVARPFTPFSARLVCLIVAASGLLGIVSVWAEGCPTRQHVLAAQGNGNARFYLLGFYVGIVIYLALVVTPLSGLLGW